MLPLGTPSGASPAHNLLSPSQAYDIERRSQRSALLARAGDEVIVPPLTFIATAFAPLFVGAVPVFADIDAKTFNIDPEDVERKITKRTKAIITVSLYGLPPDMDKIMAIAERHGLRVVEDNAQCVMGKFGEKVAGTIGDVSIFIESLSNAHHLLRTHP